MLAHASVEWQISHVFYHFALYALFLMFQDIVNK